MLSQQPKKFRLKEKKEKLNAFTVIFFSLLILYSVMMICFMLWGVTTSLKTGEDLRTNKIGWPNPITFQNFKTVLKFINVPVTIMQDGVYVQAQVGMSIQILNSLMYSVVGALILTIVPCIVAYMTCKFRYKFSTVVNTFVIIVMIIPIVGQQAAELKLLRSLGIYDNMIGSWIQKFHFLGMYYLVFFAAFKGVSKEFSEAAYIDGASEGRVLLQIMLPMVKTMIFTVFIIKFIELWNDYQNPMLYLPSWPTIAYGVFYMSIINRSNDIDTPVRLASSIIMAAPILVLFLAFKNRMIGNLSLGGVKE